MRQYLDLLQTIVQQGVQKGDRTGTGTLSIFGGQMRFDLAVGFPLITTKKVHLKSIIYELLWFLRGDTNIAYLQQNGVNIWNEWADENGDLGPIYGAQWRSWQTADGENIDQIAMVVKQLKHNPNSRRIIVSAWNVGYLPDETCRPQQNTSNGKMALPACHTLFQFYVADGKLSCQLYQRSCDMFLGVPFNIASYALLTMMLAQQCDLELGDFVWTGGDIHLYSNHLTQAKIQLARQPLPLPAMNITRAASIFAYNFSDFTLQNYQSHPPIKADISV